MGNILIINGSPRAPKSNSRRYAEIFMRYCPSKTAYRFVTKNNHMTLCADMEHYTDVLFVFPLYADALPVGFLNFLKTLETHPPARRPVVSVLINCGFLEHEQSAVAVRMLKLFCRRNGYVMGSILMLGSGEAILDTPFKYVAKRNIRKLAGYVSGGHHREFSATLPLSKRLFRLAADVYWTLYGRRNGISKQQMQTMEIEG